jgi:hypothetical protein
MKLASTEQLIVREAEEARTRAMQGIEHGTDPIIVAQDLRAAGELYAEAGDALALRVRQAARPTGKKVPA